MRLIILFVFCILALPSMAQIVSFKGSEQKVLQEIDVNRDGTVDQLVLLPRYCTQNPKLPCLETLGLRIRDKVKGENFIDHMLIGMDSVDKVSKVYLVNSNRILIHARGADGEVQTDTWFTIIDGKPKEVFHFKPPQGLSSDLRIQPDTKTLSVDVTEDAIGSIILKKQGTCSTKGRSRPVAGIHRCKWDEAIESFVQTKLLCVEYLPCPGWEPKSGCY